MFQAGALRKKELNELSWTKLNPMLGLALVCFQAGLLRLGSYSVWFEPELNFDQTEAKDSTRKKRRGNPVHEASCTCRIRGRATPRRVNYRRSNLFPVTDSTARTRDLSVTRHISYQCTKAPLLKSRPQQTDSVSNGYISRNCITLNICTYYTCKTELIIIFCHNDFVLFGTRIKDQIVSLWLMTYKDIRSMSDVGLSQYFLGGWSNFDGYQEKACPLVYSYSNTFVCCLWCHPWN